MDKEIDRIIWMGLLLSAVVACSAETEQDLRTVDSQRQNEDVIEVTGGTGDTGGTEVTPVVSLCPIDGLTQPCTCEIDGKTSEGRQTCIAAQGWSRCECAQFVETLSDASISTGKVSDPQENKGSQRFEWHDTIPQGGSCEPGHYEGLFDGVYQPEALIVSEIGFIFSSLPVMGDVRFNIEKKAGGGGEFFEVSDGHFTGAALVAFPFDGEFYGTLDCSTDPPSFSGVLKNCYYIVGFDTYAFDGIAVSNYDTINHTFIDGVWSVTEPENALIDSPNVPPEGFPKVEDLVFPPPIEIAPGDPIPMFFDTGFKGGMGTWWGSYVGP